MTVTVKICGISTPEIMDVALEAGADFVGLVLYPPSPRNVTLAQAEALAARASGRAGVVALMVDPSDEDIAVLLEAVVPDLLQLHGNESPARAKAIHERFGLPLMKALRIRSAADLARAASYRADCEKILFDAGQPPGRTDLLPGGNGLSFDWSLLREGVTGGAFMLAGGLTPENVGEAIRVTGAKAVDVSSGVESAPGRKDPERIRQFIAAARRAA
jgi:phosphoribosylanthranilate isomerase